MLSDNLFFSLLDSSLELGLEVVLGESAANVGIVLKVIKGTRVHRHKALKQLLVTVKVILVDRDVETFLNLVKVFEGILRREVVLSRQLIVQFLLLAASVHDCEAHQGIHLAGQVVRLSPIVDLLLDHRETYLQLRILSVEDFVDLLKGVC